MNFLFCCEFYAPSVGGVQEVIRQIAERMIKRGHQVTIATTALESRDFKELNGVKIEEFVVSGNLVNGYSGEIDRYRDFVVNFPCDSLLIKAAQQWTFDALWADLVKIKARKIFIPCGFSAYYDPRYEPYFKSLPNILKQFNRLIFYSNNYRDINFARKNGLRNIELIPNGASETEFDALPDPNFRKINGIPENSFVILTVGSLTGAKGHRELAEAVLQLKENGHHITLLLNGNDPALNQVETPTIEKNKDERISFAPMLLDPKEINKTNIEIKSAFNPTIYLAKVIGFLMRNVCNPGNILTEIKKRSGFNDDQKVEVDKFTQPAGPESVYINQDESEFKLKLKDLIRIINQSSSQKTALLTDFSRAELIQAYLTADLFVFASQIEYSPLVLFEAAASGTPFLSVPVGNAAELSDWLGGGFLMKAEKDIAGYTHVNPEMLALEIAVLMNQKPMLKDIGQAMKERWRSRYTWDAIATEYERVLTSP